MSAQHPIVGVVGSGAMGMGVVRSLVRNRIETFVRDIRPEVQSEAVMLGAKPADSPAALLREVDIALLLVVDDAQIEDVLFGANAAAHAFRSGHIVVVSSTVDPLYVTALGPRLGRHGVALVDAPVSGGPARAAAGTMTMMVSGESQVLDACAKLFDQIAHPVFRVGNAPGQAATFKIVNNLLAAANLAAGAEALALAIKVGIDPRAVLEVINASSGASWIVADRMARAFSGDQRILAATRILAKDVSIAAALAERVGADAPLAQATRAVFLDALATGYGDADDAALLKLFAKRAGL